MLGAPPNVDDGVACTIDYCKPNVGVVHVPCSALDPTVATTVASSLSFLYTGPDAIQIGVAPGAIDIARAAGVQGHVAFDDLSPAALATVRVLDHPEFGETLVDGHGDFTMVANGGGKLTVEVALAGFLPVQRTVELPWNAYGRTEDIILTPFDANATFVDLVNQVDYEVAQGSVETDARGSRQATLLVPPATVATMVMPDGSTAPLDTVTIRATEYTVGDQGIDRMPAPMPPTSSYTYAADLSIDEAVAAGAKTVTFSQGLPFYVDDILGFPAGVVVPFGSYDRERGQWVTEHNGVVLTIVDTAGGVAAIDTTGDGVPETDSALAAIGMSLGEREMLASLYAPGKSLMRVVVNHFTSFDCNHMALPGDPHCDPGACDPVADNTQSDDSQDDPNCVAGSVIECENGIVGETVPLVGVAGALHHWSDRTPGFTASRRLVTPFTESVVLPNLQAVEVTVDIAGKQYRKHEECPCAPNQKFVVDWDGLDVLGRPTVGQQRAEVVWTYYYPRVYAGSTQAAFDAFLQYGFSIASSPILVPAPSSGGGGGVAAKLSANPALIGIQVTRTAYVGSWDQRGAGLGGWSLSQVHAYDVNRGRLLRGDGSRRSVKTLPEVASTAIGSAFGTAVAAMPDGSVVYGAPNNAQILRRSRSGVVTTIASGSPTQILAAPDGSIYYIDGLRVRRISSTGQVATVAGTGQGGNTGDEGPAVNATFSAIESIAVGPDGGLFIGTNCRVRRVGSDGIIHTVIGTGVCGHAGDDGPVKDATVTRVTGMAFDAAGNLFIADEGAASQGTVIRKITPDGTIHPYLGKNATNAKDDGIPLDQVLLFGLETTDLAFAPDGSLYILTQIKNAASPNGRGSVARVITPGGDIRTVIGRVDQSCVNTTLCNDGGAAPKTNLTLPSRISVGTDGIYIADRTIKRIVRVSPALPTLTGSDIAVPEADGATVYVFDYRGKHLQTVDATTGTVLYQMGYGPDGLLVTITDRDGLVTTIVRDASGEATAIVGPYGQSTSLSTNADGYLNQITDPTGAHWNIGYSDGLITTFSNPNGHASTLTYDATGRLFKDTDAAGGFQMEQRTDLDDGWSVLRTTALGRQTSYLDTIDALGIEHRMTAPPDGHATSSSRDTSNTSITTLPSGLVKTWKQDKDPRFGVLAPVGTTTEKQPSGLTRTSVAGRSVILSNPQNPLSVVTATHTHKINGRTWTEVYDTANDVLTRTSPAGRITTQHFDSVGHLSEIDIPKVLPILFTYDSNGRLTLTTQGTRTATLTYGAAGFLDSATDALTRTTTFTRDADGRVVSQLRPDASSVGFSYDLAGNTTEVVPPGKPAHDFAFDPREMVSTYEPPALGSGATPTGYTYNLDRQPTGVDQPGPRLLTYDYDSAGRLITTTFPTGVVGRTFDGAGRVGSISGPTGVTLTFGYDGDLVQSVAWSGAVNGAVTRTFDSDFRVGTEKVNGGFPVAFSYDSDSLLIAADGLTISRDPQSGRVTGTTAGSVVDAYAYNGYGEVAGYAADFGSSELLSLAYVRDDLGRITDKTEVVNGATTETHYDYDNVGRLVQVTENGGVVEAYSYDANGNRTSSLNSDGVFGATFDEQDRILTYGDLAFTYTANGELASKTDTVTGDLTEFEHDALGNLRGVTLPNGDVVTYLVDGVGRRVGKEVNGVLVQGWLWRGRLQPVAELDGGGNVVARYIYSGRSNVPSLMVTGSATYRLVKDQLGSVRQVVNVSTGVVAQEIVYDAWGRVLVDTNAGFQPFGFAGGLYDGDTGMIRFGARDYEAGTGTWSSRDPLRFPVGGLNGFSYAGGDPINRIDPRGLEVPGGSGAGSYYGEAGEDTSTTGYYGDDDTGGGSTGYDTGSQSVSGSGFFDSFFSDGISCSPPPPDPGNCRQRNLGCTNRCAKHDDDMACCATELQVCLAAHGDAGSTSPDAAVANFGKCCRD